MKQKEHAVQLCEEAWHAFEEEDVFEELQSGPDGLDEEETQRRLAFYGPNQLPAKEPPTILSILLHQILNPLIFILLAAAVASVAIGESSDAIFILIVIVLNSGLGAYQEYQAEKSAAGMQRLLKVTARVRRRRKDIDIPAEAVVPGDILLLESGNKVAADLRLLQVNGLAADESFLTGESVASEKAVGSLPENTPVGDRRNMAFAGSTITAGRGMGIVVGTGTQTQVGKIARSVTESESGKPPLVLRIERFVKHISVLVLGISGLLAMLLWVKGYELSAIFFFVVALAVSAIPEGLPVALTVALSIAVKRMSERNVIVRKLTAVESLGSCTVIASDKTGTLTVNQQTVRSVVLGDASSFEFTGEGYTGEGQAIKIGGDGTLDARDREHLNRLAEAAVLANEGTLIWEESGWKHRGDAMDVAFLAMAYKLDLSPERIRKAVRMIREIPYESERKFSAALFEKNGTVYAAAKGAVETILEFCTGMIQNGEEVDIDREAIERRAQQMAANGLRVLAVAGGRVEPTSLDSTAGNHRFELLFYGLAGFIDPLRPEVPESVSICKQAGIRVLMITGDHPATAGAIARELNLSDREEAVVTGAQLSEVGSPDSPAFEKLVASTHVFARVSPTQKLEIVDALIRRGEFVAVTGDGVNDAPALRRANIGVAMGSGTDVAKEVGSMIVSDDNFASIVAGVEEGRFAYDNVRKVIYLLISTGAAEVLMFIGSIVAGLPIPLLAVQLLWLNLVTNGIQDVALAFEGGEPGAMKRKPRKPEETIFDGQMIWQTMVAGLTIGGLTFGFWYWAIQYEKMDEASARNLILLLMVLLQNFHVFNCRSETVSAFKVSLKRNVVLVFGVLSAQAIHLASMHLPWMQTILNVRPVDFRQWFLLLVLSVGILAVMEGFKWIRRRIFEMP